MELRKVKLIEAMKQIKDLQIKASDIRKKVATYCADQSHETAVYGDRQKEQISEWIQAHSDILKKILELRISIQKTNLVTEVAIRLGDVQVTKSIAEWIHRRRDLSELERQMWAGIGDRGLREGTVPTSTGEKQEVKIRRYYDPVTRDKNVELYRSEVGVIDSTLEVVNAITDLVD